MSINVRIPDDLGVLLADEAARQSMTPDEPARRLLAEHTPTHAERVAGRRKLGFIAIGKSTSRRTAADAEQMKTLAEGFGR